MRILISIIFLLLVGCSSNNPSIENKYEKTDSIINSSKKTIFTSDSIIRKTDKVISEKIEKTAGEIKSLNSALNGLQQELKLSKLAVKTITKIDTVYIETKKNFWGKTKTNTTIKSDSTQIVDSLENK